MSDVRMTYHGVPISEANAILDAVTAPGTEVFDIVRWTRPDGEERVDMPMDVLGFLRSEIGMTWNMMRGCLLDEIDHGTYRWDAAEIEARLAARYEAATAPSPPKWETALREMCELTSGSWAVDIDHVVEVIRAALAEEEK